MAVAQKLNEEYISEKVEELPTLPTIVYELTQVINDPMSSTKDVESIMENDQAMTTKVLKLVNSAYYAIPGGVSNLARAIGYIGFDTVNQLVLASSIVDALKVSGPTKFDMNAFWQHSVGVAMASETIAKAVNHPIPSDLFTAGLIHDMGKIALYVIDDNSLVELVDFAKAKEMSYVEAEMELGYPPHTAIGSLLSKKWRLPLAMKACIEFHHEKNPNLRRDLTPELNQAVDIVYFANLLTHALKFGDSGHDKVIGVPKDVMERLGIDPDQGFKSVARDVKASLSKAEDFIRAINGEDA